MGGAARAMKKNMGLGRLVLVAPRFPSRRALWRAASAQDVMKKCGGGGTP